MPTHWQVAHTESCDYKRVTCLALFLFFLFGLVIAQFYKLQVIDGEKWLREADGQHEKIVQEPFRRGVFYSNPLTGRGHPEVPQPFVVDVEKFHLYIDPYVIPEKLREEMVLALSELTEMKDLQKLREQFAMKSRSRKLVMWLDSETKETILQWWQLYWRRCKLPRNALYFVADWQRSYPYGKMLGQVLHTIQDLKEEGTGQGLPTGGLEMQFNDYLKGKIGKRLLVHSPRQTLEMGNVIEAPLNGADIYLTVNHCLQAIAEEELAKGVVKAKAKGGWAVLMDPFTGEILSIAQYPFFDPGRYRDYFNDPQQMEHTRLKALTDAHEVGSIMKPITLAVCLKANEECKKRHLAPLFDPKEKIATSNGQFPGRKKPLHDTTHHSFLNMELALQKSSNIYVARLVERLMKQLGADWYRDCLERTFGFGCKTGIELPGETCGLLPRQGKLHPNGTLEWSAPTPYSLAFGHNLLATSMQMLCAYATFANGGYAVKPTLVRKISRQGEEGMEVLLDNTLPERKKSFPRVLSKEAVDLVVRAMKYVTKPGGTAIEADIPGYTEAGKTATAEKIVDGVYSKKEYFSSFVGFAPVSSPRFVLIVSIDEPEYGYIPGVGKNHHGGHCAAPIFSAIAKRTLEYMGVAPDDPYGYPVGDPRRVPEKADWIKETRHLKELYQEWNQVNK